MEGLSESVRQAEPRPAPDPPGDRSADHSAGDARHRIAELMPRADTPAPAGRQANAVSKASPPGPPGHPSAGRDGNAPSLSIQAFTPLFPPMGGAAQTPAESPRPAESASALPREPTPAGREAAPAMRPGGVARGPAARHEPGESDVRREPRPAAAQAHEPSRLSPLKPGALPSGPIAAAANGTGRRGARRADPAQREPDEIQIHIGRIEVIAAAPAPARPAQPQPRRGSFSLDEYLRRRDGKAV
jgi:hypothetical protein